MRFWDSSALIPLFVREGRSALMEALVGDDPEMMVWWASPVECASAVQRLRREGVFAPAAASEVLARLTDALDAANLVQPGDALRARALRLLGAHPLRAADALQLAAALLWARETPAGRDFVCLYERLRTAAILEGFQVLPADSAQTSELGALSGDAEGRPRSILPPPDPELNGTQKRGFGVFKRGPGAA